MGGLAPADIRVWRGRRIERHDRVARRPGVMGDDAVFEVEAGVQRFDHPIIAERFAIIGQGRCPFRTPGAVDLGDRGLDRRAVAGRLAAGATFDRFDQSLESEASIAEQGDIRRLVLVQVVGADGVVDDGFTNRDFLPVRRARQTTAQGQQQVAIG